MHTVDLGPLRLFARRGPRLLAAGASPFGLNLHRDGGVSVSGLPRSGGTTVCWGRLRDRCERIDAEQEDPEQPIQLAPNDRMQRTRVSIVGPFMVRIGRDF